MIKACNQCGAEIEYSPTDNSLKCHYCDYKEIIYIAQESSSLEQNFNSIIPICITKDALEKKIYGLLANDKYVPNEIMEHSVFTLRDIFYVPVYLFNIEFTANWIASFGYDRQVRYTTRQNGETVTHYRTVTDWRPISGIESGGFRVNSYGGKLLHKYTSPSPIKILNKTIEDNVLVFFNDDYLAGVIKEDFIINSQTAVTNENSVINNIIDMRVKSNAQGDRQDGWRFTSNFNYTYETALIPICHAVFNYNGLDYDVWSDGVTANNIISSTLPVDKERNLKVVLGYLPALLSTYCLAIIKVENDNISILALLVAILLGYLRQSSITQYSIDLRKKILAQMEASSTDISTLSAARREELVQSFNRPVKPILAKTEFDKFLLPCVTLLFVVFICFISPELTNQFVVAQDLNATPNPDKFVARNESNSHWSRINTEYSESLGWHPKESNTSEDTSPTPESAHQSELAQDLNSTPNPEKSAAQTESNTYQKLPFIGKMSFSVTNSKVGSKYRENNEIKTVNGDKYIEIKENGEIQIGTITHGDILNNKVYYHADYYGKYPTPIIPAKDMKYVIDGNTSISLEMGADNPIVKTSLLVPIFTEENSPSLDWHPKESNASQDTSSTTEPAHQSDLAQDLNATPTEEAINVKENYTKEDISIPKDKATSLVLDIIEYAKNNGGLDSEAQILEAKISLENLPKPSKGNKKSARKNNDQALILLKNGSSKEAVNLLKEANTIDPSDVEILNNLGNAFLKQGDIELAKNALIQTLAASPSRSYAWLNLGEVFAIKGEINDSVASFDNGFRFSKNRVKTYQNMKALNEKEDVAQLKQARLISLTWAENAYPELYQLHKDLSDNSAPEHISEKDIASNKPTEQQIEALRIFKMIQNGSSDSSKYSEYATIIGANRQYIIDANRPDLVEAHKQRVKEALKNDLIDDPNSISDNVPSEQDIEKHRQFLIDARRHQKDFYGNK